MTIQDRIHLISLDLVEAGELGVGGGVRTLGHWNHNPALYQLSYTHQVILHQFIKE